MSVDPLAEKYSYQSPYNFAENKVGAFRELEGLEAVHYTNVDINGETTQIIEKNVIILIQNKLQIPSNSIPRQTEKINRKNAIIEANNNERVERITKDLEAFYSPESGLKNQKGESVVFKFNITTKSVDDTTGKHGVDGLSLLQFENLNGIESNEMTVNGSPRRSPATVYTTNPTSALSSTHQNTIDDISSNAPFGTDSHEMSHTMSLDDNGYNRGGILNSPPEIPLSNEIDLIIKNSYNCD